MNEPRAPSASTRLDRPAGAGRDLRQAETVPVDPSSRYVLDRELARGGMGRIFAGRDLRLRREVAIKILRENDPVVRERFEREVLLGARLQHPGIVPVYDAGCFASGEPYLVMKLVPGRSLARAVTEAETTADRLALLPTVTAVADAVAYAHDRGVVHRDLKPGNILVGAFGEVAIIDWGLAKDIGTADVAAHAEGTTGASDAGRPVGLTEDGAVLGTPGFMAPEQAAAGPVDARSDVYALGAIIYHLLSGNSPGAAERAGTSREPVRLVELEPWVPPDLLAIVEKAMDRDPGRRYPSAFELTEDLARFQSGQLVRARGYSRLEIGRRFVSRHPLATLALFALGLWLALR